MKVVVNRCFGGYGLSHKAVMEIAKLKGLTLYPVIDDITQRVYGDKATLENPSVLVMYYTVPQKEYQKVYLRDKKKGNYRESNKLSFSEMDIRRDDPDLIRVVESLEKEANGRFADLEIVEIPDGISYEIEEYDGKEWISETHRTW